jgi:hypothetical protein
MAELLREEEEKAAEKQARALAEREDADASQVSSRRPRDSSDAPAAKPDATRRATSQDDERQPAMSTVWNPERLAAEMELLAVRRVSRGRSDPRSRRAARGGAHFPRPDRSRSPPPLVPPP